jgi:hypothetical protein
MSDLRDLSELPGDEAYWDGLEKRIVGGLGQRVQAVPAGWWTPLAARAWTLGGLAAAAAIAAIVLMPAREESGASTEAGLLLLPDSDPAFVSFVSAPRPPAVGSLLLQRSARGQND